MKLTANAATGGNDNLPQDSQARLAAHEARPPDLQEPRRDLEERNWDYSVLFDCAPAPLVVHDHEGRIFTGNLAAAALLGKPSGDPGGSLLELVALEDLPLLEAHLRQAALSRTRAEVEVTLRTRLHELPVRLDTVPLPERDGKNTFQTSLTDLTRHTEGTEGKALRRSEERFRMLAGATSEGVAFYDEGRLIFCNDSFSRLFGYAPRDIVGMSAAAFFAPQDREHAVSLSDSDGGAPYESVGLRKDGGTFPAEFRDATIAGTGMRGMLVQDLTRQKQTAEALRQSERRSRNIFDVAPVGAVVADLDFRFTRVNRFFCDMMGYEPEELSVLTFADLTVPESLDATTAHHDLPLDGTQDQSVERRYRHKNGSVVWCTVTACPLSDASGAASNFIVIVEDITEKKKLQKQLILSAKRYEREKSSKKILHYQTRLSQLASKLSFAQEEERRRIAVEVHDGIGQNLAYCKFKLGQLQLSAPAMDGALGELMETIELCIDASRSLSFELSPAVLFDIGLEPALQWLARLQAARHGLSISVSGNKKRQLVLPVRILLFQAAREFLANVVKHAHAIHAEITLSETKKYVRIAVRDDGEGFAVPSGTTLSESTSGFGLFNVQEQLHNAGGSMRIRSTPGAARSRRHLCRSEQGDDDENNGFDCRRSPPLSGGPEIPDANRRLVFGGGNSGGRSGSRAARARACPRHRGDGRRDAAVKRHRSDQENLRP